MEDVRIYLPNNGNKKNDTKDSHEVMGEEIFSLYPIINDSQKLKAFREAYIYSLKGSVVSKILSTTPVWYSRDFYDFDKEYANRFYEFGILGISPNNNFISDFITVGPYDSHSLKHVVKDGQHRFFYTNRHIYKYGKMYVVEPVIELTEDVYNVCKIGFRDFDSVTVDDLSSYKEFFKVSDTPYMQIWESRIEELYRLGKLTLEEYKEMRESASREQRLVKTLR